MVKGAPNGASATIKSLMVVSEKSIAKRTAMMSLATSCSTAVMENVQRRRRTM